MRVLLTTHITAMMPLMSITIQRYTPSLVMLHRLVKVN